MPKKPKMKLPKELIIIPNKDKEFHEKWTKGRCMLNIPHPFRGVFLGKPNCGKGLVIKNLVLAANPPFQELFIIHCDPDYTKEWDDLGGQMLSEIPSPDQWRGEVKTLVILDDLEFKGMSTIQKRNLDRLFGFVSTHKNISVCLAAQDTFNVPPIVRRCSNLWVLWKADDLDMLANTARKTGMSSQNFNTIFNELMMNTHDSLWIDNTSKTPYALRKNGYTIISKTDGKESKKMIEQLSERDKFNEKKDSKSR
jgi:hypothetical protein